VIFSWRRRTTDITPNEIPTCRLTDAEILDRMAKGDVPGEWWIENGVTTALALEVLARASRTGRIVPW